MAITDGMTGWLNASDYTKKVLITVVGVRGSAPRDPGTKMWVSEHDIGGTIGGGSLEHQAIEIARDYLADSQADSTLFRRFTLGPDLGQCCGGVVTLLFERPATSKFDWIDRLKKITRNNEHHVITTLVGEPGGERKLITTKKDIYGELTDACLNQQALSVSKRLLKSNQAVIEKQFNNNKGEKSKLLFEVVTSDDFNIVLFGAGHVGKALVRVLQTLPCHITWVDGRAHEFPKNLPSNVAVRLVNDAEAEVDHAPAGSWFLVMTHNHPLDLALTARILKRGDFAYCGLIGSRSKRAKFDKRLRMLGLDAQALSHLVCPIGVEHISGKTPAEIAVAVAAQLLQLREQGDVSVCEPKHADSKIQ